MSDRSFHWLIQYLHKASALPQPGRPTDGELLLRFTRSNDPLAFEVLLARHGPMVLSVCRRLLHSDQDAEDAFQATFLTFVRKAASIGKSEAIGSWLYKVAYRITLGTLRRTQEQALWQSTPAQEESANPPQDLERRESQQMLHAEVNRLPSKYRVPVVLYYFEGKSNQDVARQLGCPEATVRTRLARARDQLRTRLARRGLALSTGLVAAALSRNVLLAVPHRLTDSTVKAALQFAGGTAIAGGAVSIPVATLTQGVLRSMFVKKLQHVALLILAIGLGTVGTGLSIRQVVAEKPDSQGASDNTPSAAKNLPKPEDDREKLQGTWEWWTTVTETINGEQKPPRKIKVTWAIKEDKIQEVGKDGFLVDEWTFKLNQASTPKAIDMSHRRSGTTSLGIYQLEGDTLTIEQGAPQGRPTIFSTAPDRKMTLHRVSRIAVNVPQRFANEPGCFWLVDPRTPGGSLATLGMVYFYESDPNGAALVTLAYGNGKSVENRLRPVLFDSASKRYLPKLEHGGASGGPNHEVTVLQNWRMDPSVLPARKVTSLGIEALTPESNRIAARDSFAQAKKNGIELLPWPEVGQPYSFTLTSLDGRKIRSQDLKGKVVLLDCWATWCSPCVALLPELKDHYEKWHKDGLEIIGITLDQKPETAQKLCEKRGYAWPQVWVPNDESTRELWAKSAGISSIPRVFLIDREGILRVEETANLEKHIAKLLLAPPAKK